MLSGIGLALSLGLLLGACCPTSAAPPRETTFYVSPAGNDAWSGTLSAPAAGRKDGPFATLTRARDAIRALKAKGPLSKPVIVRLRGGRYAVTDTIAFEPQDSGTEQCPITYAAFPGEKPELIGGRRLTGFKPAAQGQLVVFLPEVKAGQWSFRSLFVDGRRQVRARYPNFDPTNPYRGGFLYAGKSPGGLGGTVGNIHNAGDWMEYKVSIPADGEYAVWVFYGAQNAPYGRTDMAGRTGLTVDGGEPVMLTNLQDTGAFSATRWSRTATLRLTAGQHTIRWTNYQGGGLILGGMLLSDDPALKPEQPVVPPTAPGRHTVVIQVDQFAAYNGKQLQASPGANTGTKDALGLKPEVFKQSWLSPGAEVHVFPSGQGSCRAFMEILTPTGYDANTERLQLGGKEASCPLIPGDRYYVGNVYEELDSPGEWYLNQETGMLYLQPPPGFSARSEVIAPTLGRMIDLQGDPAGKQPVSYLRFSGLTLRCTDWALGEGCAGYGMGSDGTIYGRHAVACAVENCTFSALGKHAVAWNGGEGNRVAGCDISHGAGGGILISGSARNTVTDNHIHHIGEGYKHNGGVCLTGANASENLVSHNAIHDVSRYAITMKGAGTKNVIEYNFIQNTSLETYDTGAIEVTQGDRNAQSGTKIHGNLVLDGVGYSSSYEKPVFCSWAIYLDSFAGGYEVTDNVCARSSYGCLHLQGGKGNTVLNNIFVDGAQYRGSLSNFDNNWANNVVERNIFAWQYPQARGFTCGKFGPDVLRMDYNLYGPPPGVEPKFGRGNSTFAEWQALGFDQHGAIADPKFVDRDRDDYRLKPDSPALALGFKPLALTRAGLVGKRCTCRITPLWPEFWAAAQAMVKTQPAQLAPPVPLHAVAVTQAPTVDGTVSAGEWPGYAVTMGQTPERRPVSGPPCSAYICHDATTLYVAVTVPLRLPTSVHRQGPQGVVDQTEVVFRDASGAKPGPTFSVLGNVSGVHEVSGHTNAPEALNQAVLKASRFAARVGADQWTGEWAIPLAAAGITMRPGLKLGYNMGTFRSETNEWLIWVGALATTLDLDGGGLLILD
ncbi:right-handed parallel beta-helix repeat-containing protein [bacterium]|nr:right-handed parallel beta-helix repeat-containing protein [bacterium]